VFIRSSSRAGHETCRPFPPLQRGGLGGWAPRHAVWLMRSLQKPAKTWPISFHSSSLLRSVRPHQKIPHPHLRAVVRPRKTGLGGVGV
jgi:hypothetical protein